MNPLRTIGTIVLLGGVAFVGWRLLRDPAQPQASPLPVTPAAVSPPPAPADPVIGNPPATAPHPPVLPDPRNTAPGPAQSLLAQIEAARGKADATEWERVLNVLFPALWAADPAAAVRLVGQFTPGEQRDQLLRRLARLWAAADFAGAVTWIAGLTDRQEQRRAFTDACFAVAESNPGEAILAWDSFGLVADDQVLENLVQNWAGQDLAATRQWVEARPPSLQREQVVARVAYVVARSQPAEAAAYVLKEIPPGLIRTEAAVSVLHQWAGSDLAAATAWVAGLTDDPLRARALSELEALTKAPR